MGTQVDSKGLLMVIDYKESYYFGVDIEIIAVVGRYGANIVDIPLNLLLF